MSITNTGYVIIWCNSLIYCSVLHQIKRIDGSYYQFTQRLDTSKETKLSASLEAVNAWVNARRSQAEVEQGLPPLVDDSEPADQGDKGKEKERPAKKGLPNKLHSVLRGLCDRFPVQLMVNATELGSFDFVTEAFFLTHYCLHVGLVPHFLFFLFFSLFFCNKNNDESFVDAVLRPAHGLRRVPVPFVQAGHGHGAHHAPVATGTRRA